MNTPAKVEFITPPNNLREKQKKAGVSMSLDTKAVDQAEAVMRRSTDDFFVSINEDLNKLTKRYEEAVRDPESRAVQIEEIHALGQSVAGQGSIFGYALVTGLATQMDHYIEDHVFPTAGSAGVSAAQLDVVKMHVEAMRLVITQKMEGDGGAVGKQLLTGLGLVIKKVTGSAPTA